jgi:hypothetical protein
MDDPISKKYARKSGKRRRVVVMNRLKLEWTNNKQQQQQLNDIMVRKRP